MIQLLELTPDQATIIAILLPIIIVCVFILINLKMRDGTRSTLRRYISYLIRPLRISSISSMEPKESEIQLRTRLIRNIKVKLFFVYIGIAIFILSFVIGEFYEVVLDLVLPVSQGNTGEMRTVTSVIFQSPFSAGWVGALPWYGQLPMPTKLSTYHESWSWIFFTAAFTDNPNFLGDITSVLVLFSFVVGLAFLLPLASKTVRRLFLSSKFFFMTGIVTFTKAAIGCFAQAIALTIGSSIRFGISAVTGNMVPDLIEVISIGFPIVLALFGFFAIVGWKLWQVHYSDSRSRKWFLVFIAMSYWLGLALTIVML